MSIRTTHNEVNTSYFVTFTCYKWHSLISEADAYSAFYRWFDYLKTIDVKVSGYVIMPNHFHGLFHIPIDCSKNLNQIIANGKRFIAYAIIANLEKLEKEEILQELFTSTSNREKNKGQKHKVFKDSFDAIEILSTDMLNVKLDYIHRNPCQGRWHLADDYTLYAHSSAAFYEKETENKWITDYREIYC
ncbi:MAG: hypothetical protein COA58_00585 [Bacteroidetes bacterium]|nr:MAG: hypothetical protein COA58_00585 [Bacteroidota bacterium]